VLDPDLRSLVRAETRIIETGAIPAQLTIPFGLKGEIGLRGFFHLRAAIAREIKRFAPEVVLITGSPFYPMLLSRWIDRRWHIPVVLDFQDPWISAEGANRPRLSKGGISHILSTLLEPRALRGSRWITSVSDRQNEELASRSPWIDRARMSAIPIGGDPEDTRRVLSASSTGPCLSDKVTFSYVGNAWPRSIPVLRTLMKGLRLLKDRDPKLAERIRLRFVGTSNQPGDHASFRILPLAHDAGVEDMVIEEPARVPFLEALTVLATTDFALLFGSDEPHYSASKIFPVLMAGRPFVSIYHAESSGHALLKLAGGGIAVPFSAEQAGEQIPEAIAAAFSRAVRDPGGLGTIDPAAYADFTAHAVAGRFAAVFETVAR
jgi:hypothetical protein